MEKLIQHILLADDDLDDCELFKCALYELDFKIQFSTVGNGESLMQMLSGSKVLPDILFMDINMPRKTGIECMAEIKSNPLLQHLCVVVLSTTINQANVNILYANGAHHYFCKPDNFLALKLLVKKTITLVSQNKSVSKDNICNQPLKENFVLTP